MYFANGHQAERDPSLKSRRNRVSYHDGFMDVKEILTRQLAGQYEVQEEGKPVELIEKARGRLLVAGNVFSLRKGGSALI